MHNDINQLLFLTQSTQGLKSYTELDWMTCSTNDPSVKLFSLCALCVENIIC